MKGTPEDHPSPAELSAAAGWNDLPQDLVRHLRGCSQCTAELDRLRDELVLIDELQELVGQRRERSFQRSQVDTPEGYQLLSILSRGGQGVVYEARQMRTGRTVALKMLLDGALATDRQRRRFEREIEVVSRMNHPHIARLLDSGVTRGGRAFLALELVRGCDLEEYMIRVRNLEASRAVGEGLRLFEEICEAVSYAHRNAVIHRDLKPSNILIDEGGSVRVLDFGLARALFEERETSLTHSGDFLGSLGE